MQLQCKKLLIIKVNSCSFFVAITCNNSMQLDFRDCSQSQKDEGNSFSQVYIHIRNFQVVVVSLGHDGNKIYKQVLFMHKVLVLLIDSLILKSSSLPSPLQVPKYLTHFFKLIYSSEKGRN